MADPWRSSGMRELDPEAMRRFRRVERQFLASTSERGFEEIRADPGHFLWHTGKKIVLLFNHHEIADNYSFDFVAERVPMLRWPLPTWGVLLPFAAFGVFFARRQRGAWLLLAFAAGYAASLVVFFNLSRLRLPLAPILILFAAVGLVELFRLARARRWKTLAAALGFVALALPLVHADVAVDRVSIRYYNLAQQHMARSFQMQRQAVALSERGDERGARQELAKAEEEREQAERAYLRGLAASPKSRRLRSGLRDLWLVRVTNLHRLGRSDEAIGIAERITREFPDHAAGYAWLGTLYARQGRLDEALAALDRALAIDPDHARARRGRRMLEGKQQP